MSKTPTPSSSSSSQTVRIWLVISNAIMMLCWIAVVVALSGDCDEDLTPRLRIALCVSFLELFNAVTNCTRSKPAQVLLFAVIRLGVELIVTPAVSCASWPHMFTVACWSIGDTVRFGCFLLDHIFESSNYPKTIRYTVGPFLFPLGALGEMLMVLVVAGQTDALVTKLAIYGAAALWPIGFYNLYTQLLRQRRKFFAGLKTKES